MNRLFTAAIALAMAAPAFATSGVVFNASGEPVANAVVEIRNSMSSRDLRAQLLSGNAAAPLATAKTSADGSFSADVKGDGFVFVTVRADGFAPATVPAALSGNDIAVTLTHADMKAGVVQSASGPVANATVIAGDELGDVLASYKTDQQGRFSIPDPKRWAGLLCVRSHDYAEVCHTATEIPGQPISTNFTLDNGTLIKGHVVDASGKAVANAFVSSGHFDGIATDSAGAFTVHAGKDAKSVTAIAGDSIASASVSPDVTIKLAPGRSINGVVRDDAGHSLAGSRVIVQGTPGMSVSVVNAKGGYTVSPLAASEYGIFLQASDDFQFQGKQADLRKRDTASVDITVARANAIRGTVRDEQHHPVAGATVMQLVQNMPVIYAAGTLYGTTAVTRSDGTFKLRSAQFTGHLVALKSGYAVARSEELRPENAQKNVVMTLPNGLAVTGTVVDAKDQPVSGAGIIVMPAESTLGAMPMAAGLSTGYVEEWVRTDDHGAFTIRLNPGVHDFGFWKRGYAANDLGGVTVSESMSPIRVKLDPAVQIRGRVVHKGGKPVQDGVVYAIELAQRGIGQGEVAPDGSFTIDSLTPGNYNVQYGRNAVRPAASKPVQAPASDVVLELPEVVQLHGNVIDKVTGAPVQQFTLETGGGEEVSESNEINDPNGAFTQDVAAGNVQVQISAPGYMHATKTVAVVAGKAPEPVTISLVKGRKITGHVTSADGHPLDEVQINSDEMRNSSTTDEEGAFEIEVAPAGEITLEFERTGYIKASKTIAAGTGDQTIDVTLNTGRKITGRVIDKNGAPVEDAEIFASSETDDAGYQNAKSDKTGAFTIAGLATAHYNFTASKTGFGRAKLLDVDVTKTQPLVFTLGNEPTGRIHGSISGAASGAWMMAMVHASNDNDTATAQVGRDGKFVIEDAPAGEVKVTGMLMSMQRQSTTKTVTVTVPAGGDVEVQLAAAGDINVHGTVMSAGSPMPGVSVSFSPESGEGQWTTTTNADGTYELSGLGAGRYNVFVSDATFKSGYTTRAEISSSSTFDINVAFVHIEGHVVDDRGAPVEDAKVSARVAGATGHSSPIEGVTDATGAFSLAAQGDSGYQVSAVKKGYAVASSNLAAGSSGPVVLTLHSSQGARVRLIDGRTGATLSGFVVVRDESGKIDFPVNGDRESDGALLLSLADGVYRVSASAGDYASNTVKLSVPSADVSIPLTRGGTLVVQSSDDANELIRLVLPNGDEYVRCYCNGIAEIRLTGAVTKIDHVAPGTYRMEVVDSHDVTKHSVPVTITEGQTTQVSVTK